MEDKPENNVTDATPPAETPSSPSPAGDVAQTSEPAAPAPAEPIVEAPAEAKPSVIAPMPMAKKKKPWFLIIIAALLVIGGASGLYIMKSKDKESTGTTTTQKQDIANLKVATVTQGTFDVSLPAFPNDAVLQMIYLQTHEALVRVESITKIKPGIASKWSNPDSSTWDFTIEKGQKFHTGNPVTADAVVDSLNAMRSQGDWKSYLGTIASVTTTDENTVRIKTMAPDAILLNRLSRVPIYDTTYAATGTSWDSGSGAYMLKDGTKPTETALSLTADDAYHLGRPSVREVTFTGFVGDYDKLTEGAKTGSYDLVLDTDPLDTTPTGFIQSVVTRPGARLLELNNRLSSGVMKNAKVREAIALLIDRDALRKAAYPSQKDLTKTMYQLIPSDIPGFIPDYSAPKVDKDKALALIKEAGYKTPADLVITIGNVPQVHTDFVAEVKRQLTAAGITVKEQEIDADSFFTGRSTAPYDLTTSGQYTDMSDLTDLMQLGLSINAAYSFSLVENIDDKLNTINATFDSSERLGAMQKLHKEVLDSYVVIPYSTSTIVNYYRNGITYGNHLSWASFPGYFWDTYQK